MAELAKNKTTISPQKQLHWFVDKLISIYEKPIMVILQEYDELTCFPVDMLRKEETGLFPLGRNAGATEYDSEDQEYASYGIEMLEKIKRDLPKLEDFGLRFNKEDFAWYEDNNNYEGNGYAFYLDCDYKPIFEAYLRFMNGNKTGPKTENDKKYSDAKEDILLETLGIKIKGNLILRGGEEEKINATDKSLIYYLFYKSLKNEDECFTLKDLSIAKDIKKDKKYIGNRISVINTLIKKIVSREVEARIPKFIVKENNKRGYRLNPKIIHIKRKK
jgi:hypothetical protein